MISRALLTIGDYSQNLGWRTQLGVKTKDAVWSDLFHPTKQRNEGGRFQNTSMILNKLLSMIPDNCDNVQQILENIVSDYLNSDPIFDWRYYFIKYEQMRYDTFGMYWWKDKTNKPYEVIMMHTEKSLGGRNWNVFTYALSNLYDIFELDNYAYQGDKLRIGGKNISIDILNDKFIINEEGKEPVDISITQNENGIDTENRIEKMRRILDEMSNN